ncbi:MAG: D-2-hydroxyacid dehydrogenase [Lachnospiraceae bacterium]|nr:D-2-hydroxyacid dehydrogenase [Lachnospiraceae bacterium]
MNLGKIVVAIKALEDSQRQMIRETAEKLGYSIVFCDDSAEAAREVQDAEIIYSYDSSLGAKAPRLKWFHAASAGVDNFLKPGALPQDCLLSNSAGAYGVAVSEHGVTLTLMLLRRIPDYMENVRAHIWRADLPVKSLTGSRITVLGTGDIGGNYAKRVRGFAPECIIGVNRSGKVREESVFDRVIPQDQLSEVLPETDILFMALPGTRDTLKMLDAEKIALLPEHAIVVNVGRGNSIDQTALVEALNEGRIAGAGLDVFEVEPIPEGDPAWTAKNLLITTHTAGQMTLVNTRNKNAQMFCEDLKNYSEGRTLRHLVNRALGY